MPPRTGYCTSDELALGDVPLPMWLTRDQAVADAADEIDAHLGFIYQIPIDRVGTESDPVPSVVGLILKRINIALATGRTILQMDSAGENARLHAYGESLVAEALAALKQITSGEVIFPNVPPATPGEEPSSGVLISNLDPESNVEAFYNRIANPNYVFGSSVYPGIVGL